MYSMCVLHKMSSLKTCHDVMVTERQDGDLHMVKKEEALEQQQLTGPYPLSKVILPLSVSQLLGSPGEENTVDCCMIHLEALEGYTSQGLSICWRSCLRNSVTISEWL